MNKICTSIEQSKKLIELGIDIKSADMCYSSIHNIGQEVSYCNVPLCMCPICDNIPAWSLTALMELMNRNCYNVSLNGNGVEWTVKFDDSETYKEFTKNYAVDAAFEMAVWLKTKKYI